VKAPSIKPENEDDSVRSPRGENAKSGSQNLDLDFSWLETLDLLQDEKKPAEAKPKAPLPLTERSGKALPEENVFDFAEYKGVSATAKHEANRFDLDKRLAQTPVEVPVAASRPEPNPLQEANAAKQPMMGALFPYIAAMFFFAIVTAGAVFYFVAIRAPEPKPDSPVRELAAATAPMTASSPIAQPVIAAPPAPVAPADRAAPATAPAMDISTARIELSKPAEAAPFAAGSTPFQTGGSSIGGTGPQQNSFAAAAISNLKAQKAAPVQAAPEPIKPEVPPTAERVPSQDPVRLASLPPEPAPAAPAVTPSKELALTVPEPKPEPAPRQRPEPKPEPQLAAVEPVKAPPAQTARSPEPAKPRVTPKTISAALEAEYLDRGKQTLNEGDVAGARLLFQYLVDQGSASGAFNMGQTYDPGVLSQLRVRGIRGDVKAARTWYEKAAAMGSSEATAMIGSATR
jgi:hypothetical protein